MPNRLTPLTPMPLRHNMTPIPMPARWVGALICLGLAACDGHAQKPTSATAPATAPDISPETQARVQALVKKTLADMRRIEGGGFWLGDFGPLMDDEAKRKNTPPGPDAKPGPNLPFTDRSDNKPARWVTFDTFYIGAYKVTYGHFDVYVAANGLPAHPPHTEDVAWQRIWRKMRTSDDVPAGVYWSQAKGYCQWLGKLTGLPVDLPTEGQWEFAASNRTNSYHHPFPTWSGQLDEGRARPTFAQQEELQKSSWVYPVGLFEPSPAGLYDLLGNGFDWVQDWYAPLYAEGSQHNPTGPSTGTHKVLRGSSSSDSPVGHRYVGRNSEAPEGRVSNNFYTKVDEPVVYGAQGFRCAVHRADLTPSPKP
jgi:formylglycine-generating enzyme